MYVSSISTNHILFYIFNCCTTRLSIYVYYYVQPGNTLLCARVKAQLDEVNTLHFASTLFMYVLKYDFGEEANL